MVKEYKIKENKITKLVDELDNFTTKIEEFIAQYSNYSYNIDVKKNKKLEWEAFIKVIKHET